MKFKDITEEMNALYERRTMTTEIVSLKRFVNLAS